MENKLLAGKAENRQTSEWAFTAIQVRDEERLKKDGRSGGDRKWISEKALQDLLMDGMCGM